MSELNYKRRASASGEDSSVVLFLHGYGADGSDLLGLADPLSDHLPDTLFLAPDAPETVPGCRLASNGSRSRGSTGRPKKKANAA